MPISIYLAEAILHSSQLVSKDQSSLVLERMPTSLSNLSCSNTTRFFHFIGFTEPCWWSWLQYEPFSKKPHILLWTLQKQFQVVFLIRDKAVMFWEYYHLLQQLPWGWVYAEFTMTNKIPNKQTTWLSCTFYFTKGQNSAKHSSSPSKSGWHIPICMKDHAKKQKPLTSQPHLTSNVKQHNQVFPNLDSLKLSSIIIFQSALHLKAGHSPETNKQSEVAIILGFHLLRMNTRGCVYQGQGKGHV